MYEDSQQRMAAVEWADAIKTVSGALTKINKKSPHAQDQKMVLGTHRKAATTNPVCSRLYLRGLSSVTRSTPLNEDEIWVRQRFTAVTRAVATRAKNLSTISQDQAAFAAQKDSPGGCKTFKKWLCAQEAESYDTAHPRA